VNAFDFIPIDYDARALHDTVFIRPHPLDRPAKLNGVIFLNCILFPALPAYE
jgi:hypothetical protein